MTISRRQFLQTLGISTASASLFGISLPAPKPLTTPEIIQGRTLLTTPMFAYPDQQTYTGKLWADTILHIREHSAEWFATDNGFVKRAQVQPMQPYTPQTTFPNKFPVEAEVASASTIIREYADATAPIVLPVGHGEVVTLVDKVKNRQGAWYAVGTDGDIFGWVQAVHWRTLPNEQVPPNYNLSVQINRQSNTLLVYSSDELLFTTQVNIPSSTPRGEYPILNKQRGGNIPTYALETSGAPKIHAVNNHNEFGRQSYTSHLEVNTLVGKWLYNHLRGNEIVVIS